MSPEATNKINNGAGWLLWIGLCTLVNAGLFLGHSDTRLILGSTAVEVVIVLFNQFVGALPESKMVGTCFIAMAGSAVYMGLGVPAQAGKAWAFIAAFVLFATDSVLNLVTQDWLGLGIHVWALSALYIAARACLSAKEAAKEAAKDVGREPVEESTTESAP